MTRSLKAEKIDKTVQPAPAEPEAQPFEAQPEPAAFAAPVIQPAESAPPAEPEQPPSEQEASVSDDEPQCTADEAADFFLGQLPQEAQREQITGAAADNYTDVAGMILAILNWVTEQGIVAKAVPFIRYTADGTPVEEACGYCEEPFRRSYPGQQYCCNACGHRANGLRPAVEHTANCPLMQMREAA